MRYTVALPADCGGGFTGAVAIAEMALAIEQAGFTALGAGWSAQGNVMRPRPATRPHPPIWFGGNSRAARRRAAAGFLRNVERPGQQIAA